jgi:hypothetical protein
MKILELADIKKAGLALNGRFVSRSRFILKLNLPGLFIRRNRPESLSAGLEVYRAIS